MFCPGLKMSAPAWSEKSLSIDAGQGTEKTKAHLGATFIPSFILFKHRQPVFDRLLVGLPAVIEKILSHLGFWPAASSRAASDVPAQGQQEHVTTFNTVAP